MGGGAASTRDVGPDYYGPSPRGRGSRVEPAGGRRGERSIPAWAGEPSPPAPPLRPPRVHPRVGGGASTLDRRGFLSHGPSPRGRGSLNRSCSRRTTTTVHPRVGGGATDTRVHRATEAGPSPRGRGSLHLPLRGTAQRRSIPAWAGEPLAATGFDPMHEVHPRVGGGASVRHVCDALLYGPSPRGRGSRDARLADGGHLGSIPAWAGEPNSFRIRCSRTTVHPRVGGGARLRLLRGLRRRGPSPRGRGSPVLFRNRQKELGSIPAWAGEPSTAKRLHRQNRVHPRVGGGARAPVSGRDVQEGPSPRGRGSPSASVRAGRSGRSIPAWAGEPDIHRGSSRATGVHPRVGGGADAGLVIVNRVEGPSPRGRGSPQRLVERGLQAGSIPAWAGEPSTTSSATARARVHPRVGGGAYVVTGLPAGVTGPSPRGRGSPPVGGGGHHAGGSIPAWAGEPRRRRSRRGSPRVHPRVGGGALVHLPRFGSDAGPSPRGRGSPTGARSDAGALRSIPAWAGEPRAGPRYRDGRKVHPRVGGGAGAWHRDTESASGPSPRGRGSPDVLHHVAGAQGSIPAWAGEPETIRHRLAGRTVHPRVGGGADDAYRLALLGQGPSPRGRGSRRRVLGRRLRERSIPAWAGEPRKILGVDVRVAVHPRVGGGAALRPNRRQQAQGPSPRGRGSRLAVALVASVAGSIPAWAGEPRRIPCRRRPRSVHPRVGGGAEHRERLVEDADGPSPRGRGSPGLGGQPGEVVGSIPAWAGEPLAAAVAHALSAVHPRVGGGAQAGEYMMRSTRGPSPRGRGSRIRDLVLDLVHRSIPAWAGEPRTFLTSPDTLGVHPRVGGGARAIQTSTTSARGPSPRGRGSRRQDDDPPALRGSIPAWAGEPSCTSATGTTIPVHPRVGGGASDWSALRVRGRGPSPRGRGSRHARARRAHRDGSIPAWAGEPAAAHRAGCRSRVHPRVGGGAHVKITKGGGNKGPSPRGRGSRLRRREGPRLRGSIPAWAGEPRPRAPRAGRPRVHPRVGGGARHDAERDEPGAGPSPRGRGSRHLAPALGPHERSIPAWAGEPPPSGSVSAAA